MTDGAASLLDSFRSGRLDQPHIALSETPKVSAPIASRVDVSGLGGIEVSSFPQARCDQVDLVSVYIPQHVDFE